VGLIMGRISVTGILSLAAFLFTGQSCCIFSKETHSMYLVVVKVMLC
jgi:hypothetical protein